MNFDPTSAVAVEQNAVNTTRFDINSAKDEPQLQEATPSGNKVSGFVDFLHHIFNSPIDELNRNAYMYAHQDEIPNPVKGEDISNYISRAQPSLSTYEAPKLQAGVFAQAQGPMDLAMASGFMTAPLLTAKVVGGLAILDHYFNARDILNKYAPDTPPEIKDIAEIASVGLEAHALGINAELFRNFIDKKMAVTATPDAVHITPEEVVSFKNSPDLTEAQKTDVMNKLGVEPTHVEASLAANIPIKVPMTKMLDLTKEPYWDNLMSSLTHEESLSALNVDENGKALEGGKINVSSSSGKLGQESNQTGFEGIRKETIDEVTNLSKKHDLGLTITGGTEGGVHDPNLELSHAKGNKIDLRLEDKLNKVVESWGATKERTNKKGKIEKGYVNPDSNATYWKEATHWDVEVPKSEGTGKIKTSGLSKSIEQKAIKDGLTKDLGELPSYKQRDMDEIASKVSEFVNNDYELAKKIALGDAPEQDGLRQPELFTGIRIKAEAEGDIATLRDLALSDKASALATEAGQRVQALDSGNSDSAVEAMRGLKKSREEAGKKSIKDKSKTVKEIKEEIKKAKPKIEDWNSFIDSLEC